MAHDIFMLDVYSWFFCLLFNKLTQLFLVCLFQLKIWVLNVFVLFDLTWLFDCTFEIFAAQRKLLCFLYHQGRKNVVRVTKRLVYYISETQYFPSYSVYMYKLYGVPTPNSLVALSPIYGQIFSEITIVSSHLLVDSIVLRSDTCLSTHVKLFSHSAFCV